MIYLKDFKQGKLIYEALDSDIRIGILDEILQHGELSLAHFAQRFGVSNGAITAHIRKLHEAGLIEITTASGIRGTRKICSLSTDKLIIDFTGHPQPDGRIESAHIDVGHYIDYEVFPTCGLATREKVIGQFDDPGCFSFPERIKAGILWFSHGHVEYLIPNYLREGGELIELQFTLEVASEAPGYSAYYPSDIYFSVNGHTLGYYTSKGEYNDRAGTYNPSWWFGNMGQYGKKILVAINNDGAFINGVKVSEVTLPELEICPGERIRFRISVPSDAIHCGGVTVFGRGFGDYEDGIVCNFVCR